MLLDELDNLSFQLRHTTVEGSHLAKVLIRTGLEIAAEIVDERRIQLLTEEIVDGNSS